MNKFNFFLTSLTFLIPSFDFGMEQKNKKIKLDIGNKLEKQQLGRELVYKAESGDLIELKKIIESCVDVNSYTNAYGLTALMCASLNGHKEIVELLINNGANINDKGKKNNNRWTALCHGIYGAHKEIVELLVSNGADINAKNNLNWTAIMMVLHLLKQDFQEPVFFYDSLGLQRSSLFHDFTVSGNNRDLKTIKENYGEIAKVLKNFEKNNKRFFPQLVEAIKNSDQKIIKELLKLPIYSIDLETGDNALHIAAKMGNFKMFKFILGIRPGLINKKNYNNLIACDVNHEMQVRLILDLKNKKIINRI